ncbi:MAG TPA: ZIP family metal transporter [Lacipirellulaceae bacterium]|nr:ZIP family metal transporter [Lacipirellulaceae bacterium]
MTEVHFAIESAVAGLAASLACGMGVIPVMFSQQALARRVGLGYAFAGGLMVAASFYNLLMPAFVLGGEQATDLGPVIRTLSGFLAGCGVLSVVRQWINAPGERASGEPLQRPSIQPLPISASAASSRSWLVFLAMTIHSFPEGVAVGVGYGAEGRIDEPGLGLRLAIAIAVHNIPEGMAVAIPMRLGGASLQKCFWYAVASSLPQPAAAVPAALAVWFFEPLMLPMLGFAAGAMIFLVVVELLPDALEAQSADACAWSFVLGFALMVLVQVVV